MTIQVRCLGLYFFICRLPLTVGVNQCPINFTGGWIRILAHVCRKQPLYQLCHNYCPDHQVYKMYFDTILMVQAGRSCAFVSSFVLTKAVSILTYSLSFAADGKVIFSSNETLNLRMGFSMGRVLIKLLREEQHFSILVSCYQRYFKQSYCIQAYAKLY